MILKITDFILTGFYSGKIKFMPGTFGTLSAVPIFIYLFNNALLINILILLTLFLSSLMLLNYSYKNNFSIKPEANLWSCNHSSTPQPPIPLYLYTSIPLSYSLSLPQTLQHFKMISHLIH